MCDLQFRRYHQSAVQLQRANNRALGWFSGTSEGIVDGQKVLVKTYHGRDNVTKELWAEEVKMLQDLFHPNLPQLVGYSDEETPNPFVLLSDVETHEYTSYMYHVAQNEETYLGVGKLIKAATDIYSAALFITQHLALSKSQICLFIQLQDATSMGKYYSMSASLRAIVTRAVSIDVPVNYPRSTWHATIPYEFLMELPVQSRLGDIGYVTTTSPVFCRLFNIFDRDTTARYSAYLVMTYRQSGLELDDMCSPIFNDGPAQEMLCMPGSSHFRGTIHILPPISGTTRRLLSLVYRCDVFAQDFDVNNANSIWSSFWAVVFIDTYWLDCSVTNSQGSTPSATVDTDDVGPQAINFDIIVEVDPSTSLRQVQLVGLVDAPWSSKYHISITLLETKGPRILNY
ncbi:hypothetical protein FA95DRAFT_1663145 [Auriscalpium vulgare]|uniref:Uncharacterized protein n=1 Tax=Auriscalpium vulgare TaxID=40419 RepID=A0ACB8R2P2_9AGAM|nr:hypothetical protein FA95DRAFT_1663145 [Auriscalpium vulgare]